MTSSRVIGVLGTFPREASTVFLLMFETYAILADNSEETSSDHRKERFHPAPIYNALEIDWESLMKNSRKTELNLDDSQNNLPGEPQTRKWLSSLDAARSSRWKT